LPTATQSLVDEHETALRVPVAPVAPTGMLAIGLSTVTGFQLTPISVDHQALLGAVVELLAPTATHSDTLGQETEAGTSPLAKPAGEGVDQVCPPSGEWIALPELPTTTHSVVPGIQETALLALEASMVLDPPAVHSAPNGGVPVTS
jgi:hypothetical protein